jgi:hypothetical protein
MKMSVYRQGGRFDTIDHIELMKLTVDEQSAKMIIHARMTDMMILVGLTHGQAVIKLHQPNDEAQSFEDLFDIAVSLHEFSQMEKQNVRRRDDLAPHLYQVTIGLVQDEPIELRLRVKGKDEHDVKAKVKRLVREDTEFGTELFALFAAALLSREHGYIEAGGTMRILDIAPDDKPEWEFVDDD